MSMESQVYDIVSKAWESLCRTLFGQSVGGLKDYEEWLSEYLEIPKARKSAASGKSVYPVVDDYCEGARFVGFDELDFGRKFEPLNINDVKDIDDIIEALLERFCYTGNVVLGNSKFVESSTNVSDSHFVYNSAIVSDSKYVAYGEKLRRCAYIFGGRWHGESSHLVKSTQGFRITRCFECHNLYNSSDCYYCSKIDGCTDCMFSFGVRSKSRMIGNLDLSREKYRALKAKILSELAEELRKEKKVFSLFELIERADKIGSVAKLTLPKTEPPRPDNKIIEAAFARTTSVLLGRKLAGIDNYAKFLQRHVPEITFAKSPLSGRQFASTYLTEKLARKYNIGGRMLPEDEAWALGELHARPEAMEGLRFDQDSLAKNIGSMAYFCFDEEVGKNSNMIDCVIITNAQDCYKGTANIYSKKCAYSFWPRESEEVFGSSTVLESAFCINCYHSKKLNRAFECDSCESCSDVYFSHNCENVHNSLFCFNSKNLNHAIGNSSLPADKYKSLKTDLLGQVVYELERTKNLKLDIYNLGCPPGRA